MDEKECAWCKGKFPAKGMRRSILEPGKWRCKDLPACEKRIVASIAKLRRGK